MKRWLSTLVSNKIFIPPRVSRMWDSGLSLQANELQKQNSQLRQCVTQINYSGLIENISYPTYGVINLVLCIKGCSPLCRLPRRHKNISNIRADTWWRELFNCVPLWWCERSENESRKKTASFSSYSIMGHPLLSSHPQKSHNNKE